MNSDIQGKLTCMICYTNSPSIIILPCGHLIMCNECHENITDNKCPYDCSEIHQYYSLKGKTENERLICKLCNENKIEKIYTNCGHCVCNKCSFNTKCTICFKKSKSNKIFLV